MRKLLAVCAALILGASLLSAQEYNPSGRWYVSLQGGPMYQSNENTFAYRWEKVGNKLFTYTAAAAVGYNFNETWGVRGSVSYGLNRSAGNYKQSHDMFYPYDFKNISGFADLVLDFNGLNVIERSFAPKLYAGMGLGHTFGFSKPTPTPNGYGEPVTVAWAQKFHPWQYVKEKNNAFGFRFGAIAEFNFKGGFGIFADLCWEAYTDWFNGLEPDEIDHTAGKGYAGFPFDLRATCSLGVLYRFR